MSTKMTSASKCDVHQCSNSSKGTTHICKACKAMPNATDGQVSSAGYCGTECQKAHWTEHTTMLRRNAVSSNLRSILAPLCLRRSKQAIDLPSRTDRTHKVDFDAEEATHYNSINIRVTGFLEQQAGQTSLGSYSNILTKINSLRQICNLGTYYQGDIGALETQVTAMQEVFDGMISTGAAVCCKCDRDLSKGDENNESRIGGTDGIESKTRIATCGEIICASCFALSEIVKCPSDGRCQHQSSCELFTVSSSGSFGLPAIQSNSRLPVKMRALQEDLLALPETDKR